MPKEIGKRAIFGTLFVSTLVFGTLYYKESFYLVFLFLLIVGMHEFYCMAKKVGAKPSKKLGIACGITLFTAGFFHSFYENPNLYFLVVLQLFIICILELFRKSKTPLLNISTLFAGLVYVGLPLTLLQYMIYGEYNPLFVLYIFFIIWSYDTGAYLIGSQIGKRLLFERVSPGKTWEGAVGGLVFAIAVALFLPLHFPHPALTNQSGEIIKLSSLHQIFIAIVIVTFSTFGDLFESLMKRNAGVKDSGKILPGHGGVLDRIDSLLFAIPAVFVCLKFISYLNS